MKSCPITSRAMSGGSVRNTATRSARRSGGRCPGGGSGEPPGKIGAGESGIRRISLVYLLGESVNRSGGEGQLAIFLGGLVPGLFREAQLLAQLLHTHA